MQATNEHSTANSTVQAEKEKCKCLIGNKARERDIEKESQLDQMLLCLLVSHVIKVPIIPLLLEKSTGSPI